MQPQQGHSRQPAHAQHPRKLQQGPQLQPQQQPPADCRSGAGLAQQAIAALMDDGLGEGERMAVGAELKSHFRQPLPCQRIACLFDCLSITYYFYVLFVYC